MSFNVHLDQINPLLGRKPSRSMDGTTRCGIAMLRFTEPLVPVVWNGSSLTRPDTAT
jgi:hypothetical protein